MRQGASRIIRAAARRAVRALPPAGRRYVDRSRRRLHEANLRRTDRYPTIRTASGIELVADRRQRNWRGPIERGYHELETERFFAEYLRAGQTVVDVGANIGILTTICGKLVGRSGHVYSFEVDPVYHATLGETVRRHDLTNVTLECLALAAAPGEYRFVRPPSGWGSFMIDGGADAAPVSGRARHRYFGTTGGKEYSVDATTLDEYVARHDVGRIDVVKIDVDGPELNVLRGATGVLDRDRPVLVVELSMFTYDYGVSQEEFVSFLVDRDYEVYGCSRSSPVPYRIRSVADIPVDLRNERRAVDLFCGVPGRRPERWDDLWFVRESEV